MSNPVFIFLSMMEEDKYIVLPWGNFCIFVGLKVVCLFFAVDRLGTCY